MGSGCCRDKNGTKRKDFNTEGIEESQSSQREEKKRKEAQDDRGLFFVCDENENGSLPV
jgi:hypothetical protein